MCSRTQSNRLLLNARKTKHSYHAVYRVGLRSFASWYCGFDPSGGHGSLLASGFNYKHLGETGISGVGNKKVTSTRCHRYQRLDGVAGISCQWQVSASHMIAIATARTNHRAATSNCTDHACRSSWVQAQLTGLWWKFIVKHPSCCVA
jgi:hypothetical protein